VLDTETLRNGMNAWHGKDKNQRKDEEQPCIDSEIEHALIEKYTEQKDEI